MPKAEKGTPKWLANKMKSKGLQKLRWYCQMCQKQCRDQNGFKCHTQSEAHQRQLLIFSENPGKFLGSFSHEFERDFMHLLKRSHGTKRVKANRVYQEYIADKEHVHMNATKWETLTGFIHYLGRTGKVVVDESEEGWWITWIDRDPETIARQDAITKKEKMAKDDEERLAEFIRQQVAKAAEVKSLFGDEDIVETEMAEFRRDNEDDRLTLFLSDKAAADRKRSVDLSLGKSALQEAEAAARKKKLKARGATEGRAGAGAGGTKKSSALEEIMQDEKKRKAAVEGKEKKPKEVKDYWLKKNIVVKIVTKSLGEKYYKQKGHVIEVIDKYAAVVALLGSGGGGIKLDQDHLETVVPAIGKTVLVVNGRFRSELGSLKSLDVDNFSAEVILEEDGECVKLPYEHFSKLHLPEK